MIVLCQICNREIAETINDKVRAPITGGMFQAHREGFPEPFLGNVEWLWMRCRYCGNRPFLRDDEVLTPDGIMSADVTTIDIEPIEIPKEDPGFICCEVCGKEYQNNEKGLVWYNKHIEQCKQKEIA